MIPESNAKHLRYRVGPATMNANRPVAEGIVMRNCLLLLLSLLLAPHAPGSLYAATSEQILKASGFRGGLIVHIGCGEGRLTAELRENNAALVHGLDTNPTNVATARENVLQENLHGPVSFAVFDGTSLPYVDGIANLVVVSGVRCQVSAPELGRALAPGGVAMVHGSWLMADGKRKELPGLEALTINHQPSTIAGTWYAYRKPVPADMDDWTHYLRSADNNAVSLDKLAGPPRGLRWMASPVWARHHDKLASISSVVTSGGRLFYIVDRGPAHTPDFTPEWRVEARDAFNGILLWQRPMKSWVSHMIRFRSGPVQIARLLVAQDDKLYVAMGINEPVSVLDAATGKTLKQLEDTKNVEEIIVHDGRVLTVVGEKSAEHSFGSDDYRKKFIIAADPEKNAVLWRWPEEGTVDIVPQTLAAAGKRAYMQAGADTVALNLSDGTVVWQVPTVGKAAAGVEPRPPDKRGGRASSRAASPPEGETALNRVPPGGTPSTPSAKQRKGKKRKKGKERKGKSGSRSAGWAYATLVVKDDVVLSCNGSTLTALSSENGKKLWSCAAKTPFGKVPSVDVLVVGNVVWTSPTLSEGRALNTGEIVKKLDLKTTLVTAGHHHRCYRNKGVGDFLIFGHRGMDFFDTRGDRHSRNNWVRGVCQYGVMPANGLIYAPPHNCGCYPEAILHGFFALSSESGARNAERKAPSPGLVTGRASSINHQPSTINHSSDWPMYRYDAARSGCTATALPDGLEPAWTAPIGGNITPPVIVQGFVIVARKDNHTVIALDEKTGTPLWTFIAGGQVDSTPTVHADRVLFGAGDGSVYCLRLTDGTLLWRFHAAPADIRTVAMGNIESLWPVPGSILVKNQVAYFAAGRSSYLDDGLFLFGIDPLTGTPKHRLHLRGAHPGRLEAPKTGAKGQGVGQNRTDYKTAQAPDRSDSFSMHGNSSDIMSAQNGSVFLRHMRFTGDLAEAKSDVHHLFSTSRLLDPHEAHRSHWFYGNGDFSLLPVAYEWKTRGKYGGYSAPFGKLLVFDKGTVWGVNGHGRGYELFARDIRDIDKKLAKDFPAGQEGAPATLWKQSIKLHPRALLKAADAIYVGGAEKTEFLLRTSGGKGQVMVVSAGDGSSKPGFQLETPPVFDGMAAANGKLFVSLLNGKLVCYGANPR